MVHGSLDWGNKLLNGGIVDHLIDTSVDASVEVVGSEIRLQRIVQDLLGGCIGNHTFQATTHFDSHLVIVLEHQQDCSGVVLLLPWFPCPGCLNTEVFDGHSVERGGHVDQNLGSVLVLQGLQLGAQAVDLRLGEGASRIGHTGRGNRGDGDLGGGEAQAQKGENCENQTLHGVTPFGIRVLKSMFLISGLAFFSSSALYMSLALNLGLFPKKIPDQKLPIFWLCCSTISL